MDPLLIIDVHFLCWRAFHTTGDLSHKDIKTGIIYGFLRDVMTLQERWRTKSVAFAFDSKQSLRKLEVPTYKEGRAKKGREATPEDRKKYSEMQRQIKLLRKEYLPSIGFRNVLFQRGYEADDLIARVCQMYKKSNLEIIIVSADKDLYQLLSPWVCMFNPITMKTMTHHKFKNEYGIPVNMWPIVKAAAGCKTDDVKGINGIGEKTAIKIVNGTATKGVMDKYTKHPKLMTKNLKLVTLPFPGCNVPKLRLKNTFDKKAWGKLVSSLGMKSLKQYGD